MKTNSILVDEPSLEPLNSYQELACSLADIIRSSDPQFTIGIYGEWGTGKTTLMKCINKKILDNDKNTIIPVWFSAWQYEREEQFATVALMKTIANKIAERSELENSEDLLKALLFGSITFLKGVTDKWFFEYLGKNSWNKIKDKVWEKTKILNEVERDTVYFDGLQKISEVMNTIIAKNKKFRIVVFIDDLDRCSPQRALDVLESIKAFLNIYGFVYVLGISHKTTSKLINHAYKELGVEGRDYIKKIIQVPISLPQWDDDIDYLFSTIIKKLGMVKLQRAKHNILEQAENNPRQLKRLLNSFIVAKNTYLRDKELDVNVLFTSLLIQRNKPEFFSTYLQDSTFRETIAGFFSGWDDLVRKRTYIGEKQIKLTEYELHLHSLNSIFTAMDDEKPMKNEIRNTLMRAFIDYLLMIDKSDEAPDKPSIFRSGTLTPKYRRVRDALRKILASDELTSMNRSDWTDLRRDLQRIHKESHDLQLYGNIINMMKEDLRMHNQS